MKLKKGQGISINVIIIAAIALLVLVILAVLVLRGGIKIREKTATCMTEGGICMDQNANNACSPGDQNEVNPDTITDCKDTGKICCKQFTTQ